MSIREFLGENGKVSKWWNSTWFGVPLWMIPAILTAYWFFHLPTPGKAIGALAVVAGVMSVRNIKVAGKLAWVVLLICMLMVEFHAIDKDHADNAQKQKDFFNTQKAGFSQVTSQAKQDFNDTAQKLQIAIEGLDANLNTTKQVLNQTRQHAVVHFLTTVLLTPISQLESGGPSIFAENYINDGNADAVIVSQLAKIYVGKPDDKQTQEELSRQFEKDWKKDSKTYHFPIEINVPMKFTHVRSLSPAELDDIKGGMTLYIFRRFKYKDSTGIWVSDDCSDYQAGSEISSVSQAKIHVVQMGFIHPCVVFTHDRYRSTRQ